MNSIPQFNELASVALPAEPFKVTLKVQDSEGSEVMIFRTARSNSRIHDELPLVSEKYKEFRTTGEVTL